MFGIGWNGSMTANGSTADRELRSYARWEYGERNADWLLAAAHGALVVGGARRGPGAAERLRRWLNSFRGYAAFDVRGVDDPSRT